MQKLFHFFLFYFCFCFCMSVLWHHCALHHHNSLHQSIFVQFYNWTKHWNTFNVCIVQKLANSTAIGGKNRVILFYFITTMKKSTFLGAKQNVWVQCKNTDDCSPKCMLNMKMNTNFNQCCIWNYLRKNWLSIKCMVRSFACRSIFVVWIFLVSLIS